MQNFSDRLLAESAAAGAAGGIAGKTSIFSGVGTFTYGIMTSEWFFAAVGAIVAIATFLVNSHYRRKQFELEQKRFALDEELKRQAEDRKLLETQARIEAYAKFGASALAPLPDTKI